MSLFSSLTRIEGGQYGYHPHYRKDYGIVADVRKYFRRLFRDLDRCTHVEQSPEDRRSHHAGQLTLADYQEFYDRIQREGVGVGDRKRER